MTNAKLDTLVAGAMEAEADQDRHQIEEAILATVARAGQDASTLWEAFTAYESWQRTDFKAIADALFQLNLEGIKPDAILIRGKLTAAGATVEDAVLDGILDGAKAKDVSIAEAYIAKLKEQDRWHELKAAGQIYLADVDKAIREGKSADEAFPELVKTVNDLAQSKKLVKQYQTEDVEMTDFLASLADRRADGRNWLGLDCGFQHLNEILNGLTEGLYVFAGMPSCGKTTLLKQIADYVADKEQVPVLFWSFEQSKEELRIKSLSRIASVDSRGIWKGRTNKDTWPQVEEAAEAYRKGSGRHLTIIEAGREDNLNHIRAAAIMAKHKAAAKGKDKILVIIDYLQIIPAEDQFNSIKDKVDFHLSELRRLARQIKSPVLVVSSLNRNAYKEDEKGFYARPTLTGLKESGGIEYSADAVICLWRDKEESDRLTKNYNRKTERIELHVLKNRNGERSKVNLNFTPAWSLFDNESKTESLEG